MSHTMAIEVLKDSACKAVGMKQTIRAIKEHSATVVFIANDADKHIKDAIVNACEQNGIEIEYVDTMKQLGEACGIEVGAATAAVLKA
ncbi:MAG: large subunit ribosomal protein [Clostridiales bacterium]|nr:large subunit ribosomal protein [Clostridiales bacterium]MDK2992456.1 large subunit ribosomal protein [Clostridiales bacterium]